MYQNPKDLRRLAFSELFRYCYYQYEQFVSPFASQ